MSLLRGFCKLLSRRNNKVLLPGLLGAIKSARLPTADLEKESPCLQVRRYVRNTLERVGVVSPKQRAHRLCRQELLKGLTNGLDEDRLGQVMDQRACDREAVVTNVKVDPRPRPCTCQR